MESESTHWLPAAYQARFDGPSPGERSGSGAPLTIRLGGDVDTNAAVRIGEDGRGENPSATCGDELLASRIGKYLIRKTLGKGGQATALLAFDPDLCRQVVVKVYHSAQSESARNAVLQEGQALAQVRSPYVAQCYGADRHEGSPYLVLEYIEGPTLAEVNRTRPLGVSQAIELLGQVAEGVAAIHACGLLHRDLKPSNILIASDGKPRLVDFGLAAAIGSEQLQQISGTPAYMAPEQARGERDLIDQRTDVFGLGAVFYELLTGRPPYLGEDLASVWSQARGGDIVPAIERVKGLKPAVSRVCMRCLERAPANRFGSAAQLRESLEELQNGRRRTWNISVGFGRFRFRIALGVSVALLLLMCSATWFTLESQNRVRRLAYWSLAEQATQETLNQRSLPPSAPAPLNASATHKSLAPGHLAEAPPRTGRPTLWDPRDGTPIHARRAFILTTSAGVLENADERTVDWTVNPEDSPALGIHVLKPGCVTMWREADDGGVKRLWPAAAEGRRLVDENEWIRLELRQWSRPSGFVHVVHDARPAAAEPPSDGDPFFALDRLSGDLDGADGGRGGSVDGWDRALDFWWAVPGIEYRRVRVRILPKSSADPP